MCTCGRILGFFLVAAVSGACEEDAATAPRDGLVADDTREAPAEVQSSDASDTAGTSDASANEDAPETRLGCEGNPCADLPRAGCSLDRTAQIAFEPTCSEGADGPVCSNPAGELQLCEAGPCVLGACIDMTDPCDWPYTDRISIVTEIRFQSDTPCCHDFDGDGTADNAFADLMAQLAPAFGDFDLWIGSQIDGHHMNWLFDFMGVGEPLTNPIEAKSIDVIIYESNFDNVVFIDPSTGMSQVMLKYLSFQDEHDWIPRNYAVGSITNGHVRASDGRLGFIYFLDDEPVELLVEDMHFEGDVTLGPNGKGFAIDGNDGQGATLWGHISRDSFLTAMNGNFQWECCTAFSVEDGEVPLNIAGNRCNTPISSCEESAGFCSGLADLNTCNLVFTLLDAQLDVDSDGDGVKDAMSVGFHFKATSGAIGWEQNCGPAPTDPNYTGPH